MTEENHHPFNRLNSEEGFRAGIPELSVEALIHDFIDTYRKSITKIVLCHPADHRSIQTALFSIDEESDWPFKVRVSPLIPEGQILIIPEELWPE